MFNQAAALSRCLTKVSESLVTQQKVLHGDKGKDKLPSKEYQAVDELDYLVTFNRSITEAMARTKQDLSEGIFINMANLILPHRDSYLNYLRAGIKQDIVNAL